MNETSIWSRRAFIRFSFGPILGDLLWHCRANGTTPRRPTRSVILLFMQGGPSHVDTFDPKPDAPTNVRGPTKTIRTAVPGLMLSEHLPRLSTLANDLTVIRSLSSNEPEHERAIQLFHTAQLPDESADWPAMGAVVSRSFPANSHGLPGNIAINPASSVIPDAGFLGRKHDPHVVTADASLANMEPSEGVASERFQRRVRATDALNSEFARRADSARVAEYAEATNRAVRFSRGTARTDFDLRLESHRLRDWYGRNPFGQGCLLARRLVERKVSFIEVTLNGWDTHQDNFETVARLASQIDRGFAALIEDLKARGLLEDTLVLCAGEFGRTPIINRDQGRDHWSHAFSAVLAGGSLATGRSVGASDARGEQVKELPIGIPNLLGSILHAAGVDLEEQHTTPDGRPVYITERIINGRPRPAAIVRELFD